MAAHDGVVARRPGRGPSRRGGPTVEHGRDRGGAGALQRGADPGDRGCGSQRRVRGERAGARWRHPGPHRVERDHERRRGVDGARRAPGNVRHLARGHAAGRARRDARALAAVDRPLDRRRLARVPRRRSDEHPLRQDRGHGRGPRRRPRRRPRDPHRRLAARRGGAGPHPAVRRLGGNARHHHRRSPAAAPRAAVREAVGARVLELRRRTRRVPADPAPRRDACGHPACTTRSKATARSRPAPTATCCW